MQGGQIYLHNNFLIGSKLEEGGSEGGGPGPDNQEGKSVTKYPGEKKGQSLTVNCVTSGGEKNVPCWRSQRGGGAVYVGWCGKRINIDNWGKAIPSWPAEKKKSHIFKRKRGTQGWVEMEKGGLDLYKGVESI